MYGVLVPRPATAGAQRWDAILTPGIFAAAKSSPEAYGYSALLAVGSLTDNSIDILSGTNIAVIRSAPDKVIFALVGPQPNSGWARLSIAGSFFLRSAATYSQTGNETSWEWASSNYLFSPPFSPIAIGME